MQNHVGFQTGLVKKGKMKGGLKGKRKFEGCLQVKKCTPSIGGQNPGGKKGEQGRGE